MLDTPTSVFDLARQLLRRGDASLLDLPLERATALLNDETAQECLQYFAENSPALTLRQGLQDNRLDRFVAEHCTAREEEALCRALLGWLGGGDAGSGDDNPVRLVPVEAVREPPQEPEALERWANDYGIRAALHEPLAPASGSQPLAGMPTVAAAWLQAEQPPAPGQGLLARQDLAEHARATLVLAARERQALQERASLWRTTPAHTRLAPLCTRLQACLAETTPQALQTIRFMAARPVVLDTERALATCRVRDAEGTVYAVQLPLSGYETRGLIGQCEVCGQGQCLHVRALAGRLLDAILLPQDRLHDSLTRVAEVPSWQRFIHALRATPESPPNSGEQARSGLGTPWLLLRLAPQAAPGRVTGLALSLWLQHPPTSKRTAKGKQLSVGQALRSAYVSEVDRPVLEALTSGRRPLSARTVPLDLQALRILTGHPRVAWQDKPTPIHVTESQLQLSLAEQADGLKPSIRLADQPLQAVPADNAQYLYHADLHHQELHFTALSPPMRRLLRALADFNGVLPPESFDALSPALDELHQLLQVRAPEVVLGRAQPPARSLLLRLAAGPGERLLASLTTRPLPLGALWDPGQGPEVVRGLVDGTQVHMRRDLRRERDDAKRAVEVLDLQHAAQVQPFSYEIEGTQAMATLVAAAAQHSDLFDIEWAEGSRRLNIQPSIKGNDLQVRFFKRGDWLQTEGQLLRADAQVAFARLLQAARQNERFVPIGGDSYAEIEADLRARLELAQLCAVDLKGKLRLAAAAGASLSQELDHAGVDARAGDEATASWLAAAANSDHAAIPAPTTLRGELRPYQTQGYDFLVHRSRWATGACLADEMGLGKTIQAIALLLQRAELGPALIVAPTSVVANWHAELQRFAPSLRCVVYRGPRRKAALRGLQAHGVVLISYELLLRDQATLQPIDFATQILDEAQWIKNARSGRAKAAAAVQAGFRVALSGTPIENRLGDLWSLFSVIAPGLLGSWRRFRALFAVPIERYQNRERAALLHQLIAPFILRRTKAVVESALPARVEVVHRVELSEPEQQLYQAAVQEARELLRRRKREERTYTTVILAELTRLRQLACHPRLVVQQTEVESSKLAAFTQLLQDLLPRGHRLLVFSQFVRHLQLVRTHLQTLGMDTLYLDGATPVAQRRELVRRFQSRQGPAIFLISLKAGGTGLNLTAADYVIHLDPWWNPAAEDQASDRAHRIGQQKPVTIIKLVAADTIEERVIALHAHKRELADRLLMQQTDATPLDLNAYEALLEVSDTDDRKAPDRHADSSSTTTDGESTN